MIQILRRGWKTLIASGILGVVLSFTYSPLSLISGSYAHLEHLPLYNGGVDSQSRYNVYEALGSDYARPQEPTIMMFSIQDKNGNDVTNITAMIEVYEGGERTKVFPWHEYDSGDFEVPYAFPEAGNYQIVLSVANGPVRLDSAEPPREILSSTSGCNCDRSVFNVSISENFGTIWNSTIGIAIMGPLAVIGGVLGWSYWKRRSSKGSKPISTLEAVKYSIMLSAIAGGIVHLSIYIAHASLRLEYSIFFVIAGGMQVAYGTLYIFLIFSGTSYKADYKRNVRVNLFGLIGTAILVGLYIYTVVFPAPLSPTNMPDRIEIAGILAKSLEVFLLAGIVYIMREERNRIKSRVANAS